MIIIDAVVGIAVVAGAAIYLGKGSLLKGDTNQYRPKDSITRAEMAKILMKTAQVTGH